MSAQYVVDENGKRVSVILPVEEYERTIEALEDAEDARAVDEVRAAVARGEDEFIPWEQAKKEIEKERTRSKRGGLV
jgi:PHD/YefM family antitoxin component YafN of YafNO toxin-antitoxin module